MTATGLAGFLLRQINLRPPQVQQDSAEGASKLLRVLARLTALQTLSLGGVTGQWPQQLPLYSGLTASSSLLRLVISGCKLPSAAWEHAFPAGRRLPDLQRFEAHGSNRFELEQRAHALTPTAINRLASCCTDLQQLHLTAPAGVSWVELQSLTALSRLHLDFVEPRDVRSLTALRQVQDLTLTVVFAAAGQRDAAAVGLHHLVPLTVLTGLTRLGIDGPPAEWDGPIGTAWDFDIIDSGADHVSSASGGAQGAWAGLRVTSLSHAVCGCFLAGPVCCWLNSTACMHLVFVRVRDGCAMITGALR
jgi:hypothetical protein